MTFTIPNDGKTVFKEGGNAEPLPEGTKVVAHLLTTRKDGNTVEIGEFKQGANAGTKYLKTRWRIANGQFGQGRNVFVNVPLARKWAPTGRGKYPDGAPIYLFAGFFGAMGFDVNAPELVVPDPKTFLGRAAELVLSIEQDQEGENRNGVQFINKVDAAKVASLASGPSAPSAATPPANLWGNGASTGVTPPIAPSVWNTPTPAEAAAEKDIWGNPVKQEFAVDAADAAYAADPANAGKTF